MKWSLMESLQTGVWANPGGFREAGLAPGGRADWRRNKEADCSHGEQWLWLREKEMKEKEQTRGKNWDNTVTGIRSWVYAQKMTINFKLRWQNDACTNGNGEVWRMWFYRKEKAANKYKVTRQSTGMCEDSWSMKGGLRSPCRSHS